MLEEYVCRDSRILRCGYTTGSCAAAAAKAAAQMLLTQQKCEFVEIYTPKGIRLRLEVLDAYFTDKLARCGIKKDSGDDPDVTNGIVVCVSAGFAESGINIYGGQGVGRVTKAGLDQPIGQAAINSVPRKMITQAVSEIAELYEYSGGFDITVSVPGGEEIAQKTYNPRMGIVGGISIIGRSGIVEPMSNSAVIETIKLEMQMLREENKQYAALAVGNYSRSFLSGSLPFEADKSVICSNFIGDSIDCAVSRGFKGVLLIGHISKLVKLGAGIMNTHSSNADGRMDVLVSCALKAGADCGLLKKILECVTTDTALSLIKEAGYLDKTLDELTERAEYYLSLRTKGAIEVGVIMFSEKMKITAKTSKADELIERLAAEYPEKI